MANEKIVYGLKNLHYALVTVGDAGAVTYGTPVPIPGARSISLSTVGEDTKVYADDIVYVTLSSNQGYDGDIVVLTFGDDLAKALLGQTVDKDGALFESTNDVKPQFALLGEMSTEGTAKKKFVLYNCTAGRPEFSGTTKEDTVEAQEFTIPITASPATDTGYVKATSFSADDSWYTAVHTFKAQA